MGADDLQGKAAELMKKVLTVGVGAFFLTEESLRGLISEFKLPKELISALQESTAKTKEEFLRSLSKEMMAQVVDRINPSEFIQELLAKNEVELQIKVNFRPKEPPRD